MERKLRFMNTVSVADFKKQQGIESIEILQNESTGKCFFAYGSETGACSKRASDGGLTNPVVSQVCSDDTGEVFMLLHQKGEGGAVTLGIL